MGSIEQSVPAGERARSSLTEKEREDFRKQLQRVLDSPGFSGSQLSTRFLAYAGEAAIGGRTELDQYEIADRVLHRDHDFNPLDDASVRKVASQIRHKLEDYYAAEGASDPVIILLPRRTYVPRFRYHVGLKSAQGESSQPQPETAHRETGGNEQEPESATAAPPRERSSALGRKRLGTKPAWALAGVFAALVTAGILAGPWRSESKAVVSSETGDGRPGAITIATAKGDLRGKELDVAPGAVQLGPEVGPTDEVTVKMVFVPEHATQQAGLMLFQNPDEFVRLGRYFKDRAMMEFALESGGQYQGPEGMYQYDPMGQAGKPLWLSIRRNHNVFRGFTSSDGFNWSPLLHSLSRQAPMQNPRGAVYGFNGRTDVPSAAASFSDLSVGISFHNRDEGVFDMEEFEGWTVRSSCEGFAPRISRGVLEVSFPRSRTNCEWRLERAAPEGDWIIATMLDFMPLAGNSAGLYVAGANGMLRLVRRDLNGGSIMMERDNDSDVSLPDFPGAPLIILRLRSSQGVITASFSRDGEQFQEIPRKVSAKELGGLTEIGVRASIAPWARESERPPARFYRIQQDVESLVELTNLQAGSRVSE
jgi:hypothetical protein